MILLDTNVCICLLNGSDDGIAAKFKSLGPAKLALCSVVKSELLAGALKSGRVDANLQRLKLFFSPLRSFAFDDDCAEHAASIRADLESRGQPIGPNDLLIAATARAHACTLVTHNTREFNRVSGLVIQDWHTTV